MSKDLLLVEPTGDLFTCILHKAGLKKTTDQVLFLSISLALLTAWASRSVPNHSNWHCVGV